MELISLGTYTVLYSYGRARRRRERRVVKRKKADANTRDRAAAAVGGGIIVCRPLNAMKVVVSKHGVLVRSRTTKSSQTSSWLNSQSGNEQVFRYKPRLVIKICMLAVSRNQRCPYTHCRA